MIALTGIPKHTLYHRLQRRLLAGDASKSFRRHVARQPPLAFTFDIDGVLLRGASVLPAAKHALTILEGENPFKMKIPYILMTNGGGSDEEARAKKLTSQLGFEIKPSQLIQAHTIIRSLVKEYADKPILVLGGKRDVLRKVAEGYGFKNVFTTLDVKAWNPLVWPFHDMTSEEQASSKAVDFSTTPISAIFIFHDPRNWALDIQIATDVILSGGVIGAPYIKPSNRMTNEKPVQLIFCNPDLLWQAEFERPRLGQGAFRLAFQAVFKAVAGEEYPYTQYGKPTAAAYHFAEAVLRDRIREVSGIDVNALPNVYMIGDNPESDIAGAHTAGWQSALVCTGVFDRANGPIKHFPTHIAEDVEMAVRWAVEREWQAQTTKR